MILVVSSLVFIVVTALIGFTSYFQICDRFSFLQVLVLFIFFFFQECSVCSCECTSFPPIHCVCVLGKLFFVCV